MRTLTDLWGNPVSNASAADIRGLEGAITPEQMKDLVAYLGASQ